MSKKEQKIETPLAFVENTLMEIQTCGSAIAQINIEIEKELLNFKMKYNDELTSLKEREQKACVALEEFATENKAALFVDRKSYVAENGTFGFRTGKPKFILAPGFSWPSSTAICQVLLPKYIRASYEIAKTKLMEDYKLPSVYKHFPALGLDVVQDTTFFIEVKKK